MYACVITKFERALFHSPDDNYKNTWCEMRRKENKADKGCILQCRVNPTRDM